jgi:hypothetical protein
MINLKEIINNCHKYHYIYINKTDYKPTKYKSSNEKININITKGEKIVLIKLKTISKTLYKKEKKSPIKVSGGPLYAEINTYSYHNNILIKDPPKYKNKVYFPKKYIKEILEKDICKIIKKNILKICKFYINDKLNNGLIAINKITDII